MKYIIPTNNPKFANGLREDQEELVRNVLSSQKKIVVLQAPMGIGKSPIGFSIGNHKNKPAQTLYVCSSKMLQDQLHSDFPETSLLKGRSNYPCNAIPGLTAADCDTSTWKQQKICNECRRALKPKELAEICHDDEEAGDGCENYKFKDIFCEYEEAKQKALSNPFTILNLSYYLTEANNVGKFSKRKVVIMDESDGLEDSLIDYIGLNISQRTIQKYNLGHPEYLTKYDSWKSWCDKSMTVLKNWNDWYGTKKEIVREKIQIKRLILKLDLLRENLDEKWLFSHNNNNFNFRPIWLTKSLLESCFLHHADQFVLMSATMPPSGIFAKLFGLDRADYDYMETDCPFPKENRKIIYNPIKSLKYGECEQEVYREIEKIINTHRHQKGIIHAVSYDRMNKIASIDSKRMITHNSFNKAEQLKRFINSSNSIFVSPSSERGLDLYDDLARFAIWPKMPFPSLGDKLVAARVYSKPFGNYWYKAITAQSVIQGCGRIVRHMKDYGINYILDGKFGDIVEYTPKYFRDAIVCKI